MHKQRTQTRQVSQELHQARAMRKRHQGLFQVHQARFRGRLVRFPAHPVLLPAHPVLLRELLGLGQVVPAEVSNSLLLVRPKIHSRSSASRCRTVT